MKLNFSCPNVFQYKSADKVDSEVYFLEMNSPPLSVNECEYEIVAYENRNAADYMGLFHAVGGPWQWSSRKLLNQKELEAIIFSEKILIFLLQIDHEIAGFVEFDLRENEKDIEIVFFGIRPDYIGKGIGRQFLDWAVQYAWNELNCKRLWLHTCDLDHPNALSVYKKAGFVHYKTERELTDII